MKSIMIRLGLMALMISALAGCGAGKDGTAGTAGTAGANGTPGTAGYLVKVGSNADSPTADSTAAWTALAPQVTITGVTIASQPVVKFTVKDAAGNPVVGLGNKSQSSSATVAGLTNIGFTLAKLVPGATQTEPSKWVNYIVTKPPTVADKTARPTVAWYGTYPTTDTQGTLVDNGDGSYQYTFYRDVTQAATNVAGLDDTLDGTGLSKKEDLGDVSFQPTATHRLGMLIYGNAPGTGSNTPTATTATPGVAMANPANAVYDFRPDGGALSNTREIVKIESCSGCHNGKPLAHGGSRKDPRLCVACHTDQIIYSFHKEAPRIGLQLTGGTTGTTQQKRADQAIIYDRSVGKFPSLIHKVHMGEALLIQGYNFNVDGGAMKFNENLFPQDQRNCTKCHDGSDTKLNGSTNVNKTANGDNWKNVPSRLACGACHDGIDFRDGTGTTLAGATTGHVGGTQLDDKNCSVCHGPGTTIGADVVIVHRTTVASPNNPVVKAGVSRFEYKISGVTIVANEVNVDFQIVKDGSPVLLNTYAPGVSMITGLTAECTATIGTNTGVCYPNAGPGFFVAYATAQDGITAPSDWNSGHDTMSLYDAWASKLGNSLTLKDAATNTYTAVIHASSVSSRNGTSVTASHTLAVPADAKMVTALLAGSFVDPTVIERGGKLPGIPAMMAATGNTPDGKANVARRKIFAKEKCESCHDRLGTSPNFHDGNYSIPMCAACHIPNQGGSTGWSANFRVWVHGIHSAEKRTIPFTWHAVSTTDGFWKIGYPGVLKNCEACHLTGTYDFSASQYTATDAVGRTIVDNMLNVQAATGKLDPASASNYVFPHFAPVDSINKNYAYGLAVDNVTDYGKGLTINAASGVIAVDATSGNNLVTSPITAACSACHDSLQAISHMTTTGYGSFYKKRSDVVVATKEQCLVCHGPGTVAEIKAVHAK